MRKKIIAIWVVIAWIISFPMMGISAKETIAPLQGVAIGDSIPAFYGVAETEGYVSQLSALLNAEGIANEFTNLAVSGLDTQTLLNKLSDDTVLSTVKNADIITLNIGGNNILIPYVNMIMQQLAELNITDVSKASPQALMKLATMKLSDEQIMLLKTGVTLFSENFPMIIKTLREAAPNARIYVNTVYNPIPELLGINEAAELLISLINEIITGNAADGGYAVVDIYRAYKDSVDVITNFDIMSGMIDIHPNVSGHTLIAKEIAAAIMNIADDDTNPQYLTRGEVISEIISLVSPFITIADNIDLGGLAQFTDVTPEHKNYELIMKAKAYQIVVGTGNAAFNPDSMMTRQDFAIVMTRLVGLIKGAEAINIQVDLTQIISLTDFDAISDYAKESVAVAISIGVIMAEDGKIDPMGGITSGYIKNVLLKIAQ